MNTGREGLTYRVVDIPRVIFQEIAHIIAACLTGRWVEDTVFLLFALDLDTPDREDWGGVSVGAPKR